MLNTGVSVIICCYNSELLLDKTLKHIANQNLNSLACEIILVDNASTDNTSIKAQEIWNKIGPDNINLNIVYEANAGLANARKTGVKNALFEYLVFCDDDNWLDENYIQNIYRFFEAYPNVGILGGIGSPEFEDPLLKPIWFDKFSSSYAVGQQREKEGYTNGVYGAGMAIRKGILKTVTDNHLMFLNDRKENQLTSGGDSEICYRIQLAGYQILYSSQLTFKHFLPVKRLTWDYIKKLHVGFAKTNVILNLYERALNSSNPKLPYFYWLKKAFYYWGIYIKYWQKQYSIYKIEKGSIEEIHHLTWRTIALSYLKYNFKTVAIYKDIFLLKTKQLNEI